MEPNLYQIRRSSDVCWVDVRTDDLDEVEAHARVLAAEAAGTRAVVYVRNTFNDSVTVMVYEQKFDGGFDRTSISSYEQFYGQPYKEAL